MLIVAYCAIKILWVPFIAFMYKIDIYGNGVGLTTETAKLLSEDEIQSRTKGAKLLFAAWMFYMGFVWSLKGALLCLYWKLAYAHAPPLPPECSLCH